MIKKILQTIFSVTNEYNDIFKTKVITVLGIKIKFKNINKNKLQESLEKQSKQIKDLKEKHKDLKEKHKELKEKCKDLEKRTETNYKIINAITTPSQLPKAKGILREYQLAMLDMLKVIKQLCDKNNLIYWLDGGSLLGAVRHKGFVPWDGDGDVCLLRDDFLKLAALLKEYYKDSDDIYVRELYRQKSGRMKYQIRIRNKGEQQLYGVDIFPIDKYYKGNLSEEEMIYAHNKVKEATRVLDNYTIENEEFSMDIDKAREYIVKLQNEIIMEGNSIAEYKPALYTGIDFTWVSPTYFVFNWDTVFPLRELEFEGIKFNCPNDLDTYLSNYYRNYMLFPSKIISSQDRIDDYIKSITSREE